MSYFKTAVMAILFAVSAMLPANAETLPSGSVCPYTNYPDCVNLQIFAAAHDAGFVAEINRMDRPDRIEKIGPVIYAGLSGFKGAPKRFRKSARSMTVTVMFWMKPGFDRVAAVAQQANSTVEFRFDMPLVGADGVTKRAATWKRDFAYLPGVSNGPEGELKLPNLALTAQLDAYGLGWGFTKDFLRQVDLIMICPKEDTVWPRRKDGGREGLVITKEEIAMWLSEGDTFAVAGIVDSR